MPELYKNIEGWFDFSKLYDEMIREFPSGNFVEIGCWMGKSSVYLLEKIKEEKSLVWVDFVDTWLGQPDVEYQQKLIRDNGPDYLYNIFVNNIKAVNLKNRYEIFRMKSDEAAKLYDNNSLDFVFIDADHTYEACLLDIKSWLPKVKPGGVLAGHDYEQPSVKKAVGESLSNINTWIGSLTPEHDHTWIYRKNNV